MINPLSESQVRDIIRAHPTIFAAMSGMDATGAENISLAIAKLLETNPPVVHAIAAAGMEIAPEAAARMGFLANLTALLVVQRTAQAGNPHRLLEVLVEEFSRLNPPGLGSLQ